MRDDGLERPTLPLQQEMRLQGRPARRIQHVPLGHARAVEDGLELGQVRRATLGVGILINLRHNACQGDDGQRLRRRAVAWFLPLDGLLGQSQRLGHVASPVPELNRSVGRVRADVGDRETQGVARDEMPGLVAPQARAVRREQKRVQLDHVPLQVLGEDQTEAQVAVRRETQQLYYSKAPDLRQKREGLVRRDGTQHRGEHDAREEDRQLLDALLPQHADGVRDVAATACRGF